MSVLYKQTSIIVIIINQCIVVWNSLVVKDVIRLFYFRSTTFFPNNDCVISRIVKQMISWAKCYKQIFVKPHLPVLHVLLPVLPNFICDDELLSWLHKSEITNS